MQSEMNTSDDKTKTKQKHVMHYMCVYHGLSQREGGRDALIIMMTSSNGNIFRDTGLFLGESTGDRWILIRKASDAELWCFLWSVPE